MRYEGQTHYELRVAGVRRLLPVEEVRPGVWVPFFRMVGDVELTNACARALAAELRQCEFEVLVALAMKSAALAHMISTYLSEPRHGQFFPYVVCRRTVKRYMRNPVTVEARSIMEPEAYTLVLNGLDAEVVRGKRVAVVDDVVSTGGTFRAAAALMERLGARISAKAAVLLEGDAYHDPELIHLERLPVFTAG
ncbi:MAG: phosphoribosyltransferase family protein [Armatimonadota bacterium]|nr:phosphoribosyltransferase family protein [Armatimonadota bacterium]MDR7444387.1 phosphoribosyltransferase family protein [Armatimonadota bacterium]MDR7570743.1 phosphoribosyltransferase family protein [Armatimonadota bacterium]MDR7614873.1 phosphoribosyltransferase family protein [Armatimonadota bacterium]